MAQITVNPVSYAGSPALWNQLLRSDPVQIPLGSPLDQEYMRAYLSNFSFRDLSMIASAGGRAVAGMQVTAHSLPDGQEHIDFYGRPILLRKDRDADIATTEKAERMLAEELWRLRQSLNFPAFHYLETCAQGRLSDFAVSLLKVGCTGVPVYKQIIDLELGDDDLRGDIRKSYRSLINWGEKHLAITVHDHGNTTPEVIEDFRRLHIRVAGRETRSPETWRLQHRQVMENEGFIITGRLEGQLVTAALFIHSPSYCCYAVGASIREMFDKPLSHAILWRSIVEAKQRGCRVYEMGDRWDLYPEKYSDQEKNIAVFKSGFGGRAVLQLTIGTVTVRL